MASESSSTSNWQLSPPSVMDIVAAYFPESNPKGALRLRPCLVLRVWQNVQEMQFACEVAYGTKNLKTWSRLHKDVIIQNFNDLDFCGLPVATRFDNGPKQASDTAVDNRILWLLVWVPFPSDRLASYRLSEGCGIHPNEADCRLVERKTDGLPLSRHPLRR